MRLFLGIRVSLDTAAQLAAACKELRRHAAASGLKWVAPASYHVTLKFLGWTRADAVEAIRDGLDRELGGITEFALTTRGLGAFPTGARARVLWAGIEDGGRIAPIVDKIETAMEEIGYPREKRPFHAHVTLARAREVANLEAMLVPSAEQNFSETFVDSVVLFESVMKPSGSEYSVVTEWKLEPSSSSPKRHTERLKPSPRQQEEAGEDEDGYDDQGPP